MRRDPRRPRCLATGLAVLVAVWAWPLPSLGAPPFASHMIMHMAVVAVAAPLVALGIASGRLDPTLRWPALASPLTASMIELVVVWAWHAPGLHHAARHDAVARIAEQASFLGAGLFLWIAALGGTAERRRARAVGSLVALLLTSMHMTLLGALLALGRRELYSHGEAHGGAHGEAHAALSAIHDQQVGGVIMLFVGGVAYLVGGLAVCADALLSERASASKERAP